uniref:Uncharacterized protein n=1 Tax=Arundo donax TaxID=35708 RepID=A0A0A9HFE0_ARUDO
MAPEGQYTFLNLATDLLWCINNNNNNNKAFSPKQVGVG